MNPVVAGWHLQSESADPAGVVSAVVISYQIQANRLQKNNTKPEV